MQNRTAHSNATIKIDPEFHTALPTTPSKPSPQPTDEVAKSVPVTVTINRSKLSPNFPIENGKLTIAEDISVFIRFNTIPSENTAAELGRLGLEVSGVGTARRVMTGTLRRDANIALILENPEIKQISQSQQLFPLVRKPDNTSPNV